METLRATEPLHIGQIVLIPIQRVRVEPSRGCGGVYIHAFAEPRAIVVHEGDRWRATDLNGVEIGLEPLLEQAAGLADRLRRSRHMG